MNFIKQKKYLIFIIIIFLILIFFNSKSVFAIALGQTGITINVTPGLGGAHYNMSNPNTLAYCIQQGQNLNDYRNDGALFKVTHHITISGITAKWKAINTKEKKVNSSFNVQMAWIINQKDPGSNHLIPTYSEKAKAIYQFFPKWTKRLGITGIAINGGGYTSNLVDESRKYYDKWKNQAEASIKNNTSDVSKIKKELYVDSATKKEYMKIGPINLTYVSQYKSAYVNNQNNKKISVKYARYERKKLKIYDKIKDASKSGQDFYIMIETSQNVSAITFNATVRAPKEYLTAHVYILQEQHGWGRQNWIVAKAQKKTTYTEASIKISINLENMLGDLKIKKIEENTKTPLSKVGFKIYYKDTKEYVANANGKDPATYTKDINKAKEFITNNNGELEIKKLKVGNYTIYETKNPNEGYETITTPINIKELRIEKKVNEVTIVNRKGFISLSGVVWLDVGDGKQTFRNNLYGEEDKKNGGLIEGLTVELIHDGQVIKTTETDSNGKYKFENIGIDQISKSYISFKYNGMSYQCVTPNLNNANGSKATEGTQREEFNNKFVEIKKGEAIGINKEITSLEYNKNENYESILDLGADNNENGRKPYYDVYDKYTIEANTYNAYNGYLDKIKTPDEIRKNNIKEITDINLGIYLREQPNAALIKDLNNVKVSLKGQTYTYNYRERFNNPKVYTEGKELKELDPQIKFQGKYSEMSYSRPLYASDIAYQGSEELTVRAIYEIGIINKSTNLKMKIPIIEDYFDNKYELKAIGKSLNSNGYVNDDKSIKREELNSQNNYKGIRIYSNLTLEPQKEEKIYIELEVPKDEIVKILDGDTNIKLDNIAEIAQYGTLDKDGKIYAGIDENSEPGNVNPINPETYEDDTDKAPGLSLILQKNPRKVTGKVFLENIDTSNDSSIIMTGEERKGNGQYDEGEKGIEGIEVQLVYADNPNEVVKIYDEDTKTFTKEAIVKTDKNGNFEIAGLEIGNYIVKYIWGNNEYKVQNYKGTIVNEEIWKQNEQNQEWYKNTEPRYSDAVDNYETRQKIDNQIKNITNDKMNILKEYIEGSTITLEDGNKEELITKMDSKTQDFKVNIGNNDKETNVKDEFITNPDGSLQLDPEGNLIPRDESQIEIKNMDFGIVERPKQQLNLEKHIKQVKITLPNGEILIDAKVIKDENGKYKLEEKVPYTVYLPKSNANEGALKIEIDQELIEGAKLDVIYEIIVNNISEQDYISEEYYKFGTKKNNPVMMKPNIIDYLDENLIISDKDTSNKWEKLTLKEKEELLENGTLDKNLQDYIQKMKNVLMHIGEQNLKSGEKTSLELNSSRLLAKNDEIILSNKTEIIEIERTGGRPPEPIPGNFNPATNEPKEPDGDISEKIIILPPTGLSKNTLIYILLGISTLGILTSGIILIKKFVLRK